MSDDDKLRPLGSAKFVAGKHREDNHPPKREPGNKLQRITPEQIKKAKESPKKYEGKHRKEKGK